MNDPELKQLFKKTIFIVLIILVFTIPIFLFYINKLYIKEDKLLNDISNKKTMMLYITENNCDICKTLKEELNNNNIKYKELNKDKSKDYKRIISNMGLDSSNIYAPTLIYIEKGEVISYIVDIESIEKLNDYINNYK